jgi:hypothetical protein
MGGGWGALGGAPGSATPFTHDGVEDIGVPVQLKEEKLMLLKAVELMKAKV